MEVVLEAGSGKELLNRLKTKMPDVLLLDIEMPEGNGFEVMEVIRTSFPQVKVIALSAYENSYSMIRMFRLGAMGYLKKGCDLGEMVKAIFTVNKGHFYYDDPECRTLIHRIQNGFKYPRITGRELEFLHHCCTEMKYKEIAAAMGVSERTVEGYRQSLCDKLELESRAGLIIFALRSGLVTNKNTELL